MVVVVEGLRVSEDFIGVLINPKYFDSFARTISKLNVGLRGALTFLLKTYVNSMAFLNPSMSLARVTPWNELALTCLV